MRGNKNTNIKWFIQFGFFRPKMRIYSHAFELPMDNISNLLKKKITNGIAVDADLCSSCDQRLRRFLDLVFSGMTGKTLINL